jgi:hypothetical protein
VVVPSSRALTENLTPVASVVAVTVGMSLNAKSEPFQRATTKSLLERSATNMSSKPS